MPISTGTVALITRRFGDTILSERLTTTIKHLKEGLTSMPMSAARHSIESWQTELKGYEGTAFHTIATDLGHLHEELGNTEIDGAKVGKLLAKLGKETIKVAKKADGSKHDNIEELGSLLESAAEQLQSKAPAK
jgi:hypothetical protein